MAVQAAQSNVVYSKSGVLNSKMTKTEVTNSGNQKAIIEFNKANTDGDEYLTSEELAAYDASESKKSFWKKVAIGTAILGGVAALGYAIYKGVNANKALQETTAQLNSANAELAGTKEALTTTEGVLTKTEDALTEARSALGYGQGTVKAGDEALQKAFSANTKGGKATFTLAEGTEEFPNIWDKSGGMYTPKKGDIILGYGEAEASWGIQHPGVLKEMEEKGMKAYVDRAVSAEPQLMYETYIGQDGRDFLKEPLKFGETVAAQKKIFPAPYTFAEQGTKAVTLEAANGAGEAATVGVGQFIQVDAHGNPYVKDVKDLIKRLTPEGEVSEGIFAKAKEFIKYRDSISASSLADSTKQSAIARAWEDFLQFAKSAA